MCWQGGSYEKADDIRSERSSCWVYVGVSIERRAAEEACSLSVNCFI